MAQPNFETVATNSIHLRVALAGQGPLVVLVHGWPESWYSWRHQIPALAEAGYREGRDLMAPGVPALRPPVHQHHKRSLTRQGDTQVDAVGRDGFKVRLSHCAFLPCGSRTVCFHGLTTEVAVTKTC